MAIYFNAASFFHVLSFFFALKAHKHHQNVTAFDETPLFQKYGIAYWKFST